MTPPKADVAGETAPAASAPSAASACLTTLRDRADFLRAARARRQAMPGFVLQARRRGSEEPSEGIRVGFTCSRKVGNAVARNRAKRRLRALAREVLPREGRAGWDYVLIGRAGTTATRPYIEMKRELGSALTKLHQDTP